MEGFKIGNVNGRQLAIMAMALAQKDLVVILAELRKK
jgi:hypothetical protein